MKNDPLVKTVARPSPAIAAIEAYIASVPEPARTILVELRAIIRSASPKDAVEVISYGIPAFAWPKPYFGYAAFKSHIGVFPFSGSFYNDFDEDLKAYVRTRSSLHLPFAGPLPVRLIRKLVRARVATLSGTGVGHGQNQ